ncbi:MAG: MerR family transcriptional regulator [Solirubrobacterales bacterium]
MTPVRRIGEVAAATGLTVRTLHHYDDIGLLAPSARSEAGYRLYADEDVRRLYRIVAFRRLGFALGDIGALLDGDGADPRPVIRAQLARLDAEAAVRERLRVRLMRLLDGLEGADGAAADLFLDAIEGMTMAEKYYTPEQLEQLAERREALGDEAIRKAEADWASLIAEAQELRASGAGPTDPRAAALADRWAALVAQFTGGDIGIHDSLNRMYEGEGPQRASRGAVPPELFQWMGEAVAARRAGG